VQANTTDFSGAQPEPENEAQDEAMLRGVGGGKQLAQFAGSEQLPKLFWPTRCRDGDNAIRLIGDLAEIVFDGANDGIERRVAYVLLAPCEKLEEFFRADFSYVPVDVRL